MSNQAFENVSGAYAAMYTPFTAEGKIDEAMIGRQVEFGIANGLRGFYLTGSTGEGMLMSYEERKLVYERVVKACAGRAKTIAHVGTISADESVRLARAAAAAGCDWASSIWPVFYGRAFDCAYNYYRRLSEATDLPFMVYALGTDIVPDRDAKLFDLRNVKGMKYTGHSVWNAARLRNRLNKETAFFAGADEQALCSMSMKDVFCGCIGSSQNSIPHVFSELCDCVNRNDLARASDLQGQIVRFVEVILAQSNGSWHKACMRYIGLDCGSARAPNGWPLTDAEYGELAAALDKLGFVKKAP